MNNVCAQDGKDFALGTENILFFLPHNKQQQI